MTTLPRGFFGDGEPVEVAPGTLFLPSFANAAAFITSEGVLLVDCGHEMFGARILEALRKLTTLPVVAIVFTHGHVDHAFGVRAIDDDARERGHERPRRIAHVRVAERFLRYQKTRGLNEHINSVQFGVPARFPSEYPQIDQTYESELTLTLGGETFELVHGRGETDDATWVYAPSRGALCTGDFFIGCSPNCGNPQKVQRYPDEWAAALRRMALKKPKILLPGHGPVITGEADVYTALSETSEYLEALVEQTLARMNRGERPSSIIHEVVPPAHLKGRWYLEPLYDRPEFIVRNLLRLHGGWWNGNPAELLPSREENLARHIAEISGGVSTLIEKGRALLSSDIVTACHFAEWATLAAPTDKEALALKREAFLKRASDEPSLMARNIFLRAAQEADDAATRLG
ncbi:MAG: MBL fold metallo-hydrolase [Polyangiaceae bacterium]|nr:MBL fold metallo-hydrolase [Polyangiaceae bacterium]